MAEPQFSRGDLVWFDPGIGYVLPGEVTEFHPQAQVRVITDIITDINIYFIRLVLLGLERNFQSLSPLWSY